jgi:predicted metalloprotease
MKWEEGEESENIEDRRGGGAGKPVAIGGVGLLVVLAISYFMGVNPQQLLQVVNDSQSGQQTSSSTPGDQGSANPASDRSRVFASKILRFTEKVWTEKFQEVGKTYTPPHMVLFTDQVQTSGCGVAPGSVGPFYCPAGGPHGLSGPHVL